MERLQMRFGGALHALKQGFKVARLGWNGKDMFVFMRPADNISVFNLLNIKSLPKCVKDYFELKYQPLENENYPILTFTEYLCLKAADDTIVNGWLASQTDMLAEDWIIID